MITIEIDGEIPGVNQVWAAFSSYGHFTALQVREGRTRGLALHLRRLESATKETFGVPLDLERIRALIRHALGATKDGSVRVYLFEGNGDPRVVVTVKPPAQIASPQQLRSIPYRRPSPHIKHVTTDQGFYRRRVQQEGADDALLTYDDGTVCETSMANIGFLDASGIVWPEAEMLRGITMQLLEEVLPQRGVLMRRTSIRASDVSSFEGAFLSNARGIAAVSRIDGAELATPVDRLSELLDAYASVPWDEI
jgi:branched-subunit amino acid aminotransferase/4-amino-4-deoxychorismate lyase